MSEGEIPDVLLKVLYDFEYVNKDKKVSIKRGERLFLIKKTNPDWWQVIRNSSQGPFYVPAQYVQEFKKPEKKTLVYKKSTWPPVDNATSTMNVGNRHSAKLETTSSHANAYADYRKTDQLTVSDALQSSAPDVRSDVKHFKQELLVNRHNYSHSKFSPAATVQGTVKCDPAEVKDCILLDKRKPWVVEELVLELSELHNLTDSSKGNMRQVTAMPKSEDVYSQYWEGENLYLNVSRKEVESTFKVPLKDPQHYLEVEGLGISESKHSLSKSDKTDVPQCYIPAQTDNLEASSDCKCDEYSCMCLGTSSSEEITQHTLYFPAVQTVEHNDASLQQKTGKNFKVTEASCSLCELDDNKKTEDRKRLIPITDKMLGKVKSKLSYSRSFKTKKDLNTGTHRGAGNSVLSSSWENKLDAKANKGAVSSVNNVSDSCSKGSTISDTSFQPSERESVSCEQALKSNTQDIKLKPENLISSHDGKNNVVAFNSLTDICSSNFETLGGVEVKSKLSKSALAVDSIFSSYSDSEDAIVPGNSLLETKDISADSISIRSEEGLCVFPSEKALKFNNSDTGLSDSVLYIKSDDGDVNLDQSQVNTEDSCNDDVDSGKGTGRGSIVSRSRVQLQQECKHAQSPPSPDSHRKPNKILGSGWVEYSTADGRPYFWNLFSHAKSWKPPRGLHRRDDYTPDSSVENLRSHSASPIAESTAVPSYIPLPEGWNIDYDEDGQPYYTNEASSAKAMMYFLNDSNLKPCDSLSNQGGLWRKYYG